MMPRHVVKMAAIKPKAAPARRSVSRQEPVEMEMTTNTRTTEMRASMSSARPPFNKTAWSSGVRRACQPTEHGDREDGGRCEHGAVEQQFQWTLLAVQRERKAGAEQLRCHEDEWLGEEQPERQRQLDQ